MSAKNSHCGYCGARHDVVSWPRTCPACGRTSFLNPAPVAVMLVPIIGGGLLAIRRGISPGKGKLALPGGFIDIGESWQQAGAREVHEETHVAIEVSGITEYRVRSAPDGSVLLVFGIAPPVPCDLPPFEPTNETTERVVLSAPVELAFPLHTQVVADYFANATAPG